ncbi:hypothetical protein GW17_00010277 [Ensete ventricosum]|nr:hypothetical protein GW17_00010277 [Ensete ventricosum]
MYAHATGQCILFICKNGWSQSWFRATKEEDGCLDTRTFVHKLHQGFCWDCRLHILYRFATCPVNLLLYFPILVVFSADSLSVESLLELLDEENLRKHTAIPSPEWSSDHIALLAEFRCKPRIRR